MGQGERRHAAKWTLPVLAVVQVLAIVAFAVYMFDDSPAASDQVDFELVWLPFSPLLFIGLCILGAVVLVVRRRGFWRDAALVTTCVSGAVGLAGAALVGLAMVALSSYGADFDYPAAPPHPSESTVVASADGFDDDDPMRGREVVIEVDDMPLPDVLEFYRDRFPASDGWVAGSPEVDMGGGDLLCLVNTAADGYDEYLEIYPHPSAGGAPRHLVSLSRLHVVEPRKPNRCGLARIWFPSSL